MGIKMQGVIGEGGYRVAKECEVNGKAMVAKEYLPNSVDIINELGLALVKHAKKSVQMHVTAAHMAMKFGQVLRSAGVENHFRYIDCFLGMVIDGPQLEQVITVEPKLDGVFTKYINNDGEIFNVADLNKEDMAEALTHYSYELSNQQLLLVDVQGVGW